MKTTTQDLFGAVDAIRDAATTPRGIVNLREWLKIHGYEDITKNDTRRTTLLQQKNLVEELRNRYRSAEFGTHILAEWLVTHGYEKSTECEHRLIVRLTGRCSTCSAYIQTPLTYNSDEAIAVLQELLDRR